MLRVTCHMFMLRRHVHVHVQHVHVHVHVHVHAPMLLSDCARGVQHLNVISEMVSSPFRKMDVHQLEACIKDERIVGATKWVRVWASFARRGVRPLVSRLRARRVYPAHPMS